jgi:hypothetical protein
MILWSLVVTFKNKLRRTEMSFYTRIPNTDILHSKIDVLTWTDPTDEENIERAELIVDNDGVFITSVVKGVREDISIGQKDLAIAVAKQILKSYE